MTARWARSTPTRPRECISRLESMITMGGFNLPAKTIREMIVSSVDVIIQAQRLRDGSRKITHVTEVVGLEGDVVTLQDLMSTRSTARTRTAASSAVTARPASPGRISGSKARYFGEEKRLSEASLLPRSSTRTADPWESALLSAASSSSRRSGSPGSPTGGLVYRRRAALFFRRARSREARRQRGDGGQARARIRAGPGRSRSRPAASKCRRPSRRWRRSRRRSAGSRSASSSSAPGSR